MLQSTSVQNSTQTRKFSPPQLKFFLSCYYHLDLVTFDQVTRKVYVRLIQRNIIKFEKYISPPSLSSPVDCAESQSLLMKHWYIPWSSFVTDPTLSTSAELPGFTLWPSFVQVTLLIGLPEKQVQNQCYLKLPYKKKIKRGNTIKLQAAK